MKIKYLKLKNWLLITVMGALGFSSCHSSKKMSAPEEPQDTVPVSVRDRGEMRLMYGVPTMDYQIRGQVKDAKGKPVKDIRVNMLERNMETTADGSLEGDPEAIDRWLEQTEVRTDKKGRFELKSSGLPQEQVRLLVRDVDGKENGEHRNRVVEMPVTPDNVDRTNAGGWNQGTFNQKVKINLEDK
ncbi:MAG: radical SAM-associated putative lipoprotein [Bacteroidales bacterium]|nr:radical SAM-associated putative lipoprotein [Bacteroidales bacterium]